MKIVIIKWFAGNIKQNAQVTMNLSGRDMSHIMCILYVCKYIDFLVLNIHHTDINTDNKRTQVILEKAAASA